MTEATHQVAEGDIWEGEVAGYSSQPRTGTRRSTRRRAKALRSLTGLVEVIEREIAPRLGLRRLSVPPSICNESFGFAVSNDDVEALASLVLGETAEAARRFVEYKHTSGASLESLYIELLAPAARHLGDGWSDDRLDFAEVTLGLGHLQQLVRDLSPMFQSEVQPVQTSDRVLLIPAPGEQHTFGLSMVAEFFRRSGWDVWGGPLRCAGDLNALVRSEWFDLVGISLSRDMRSDLLADSIRRIRRSSRNRTIGVIVGGPLIIENPDFAVRIGADGSVADGTDAPLCGTEIVRRLRQGG